MKQVAGTLFFENGKLLLVKPRRIPALQVAGGSIEGIKIALEAAIWEFYEELGKTILIIIIFLIVFEETATSNTSLKILMNLFIVVS